MKSSYVHSPSNEELGWVGAAFTAAKTAVDVGGKIAGIFGKKKSTNAGSASFVDAVDNFEKISTSAARNMVEVITEKLANGATEQDIGSWMAAQVGEYDNGQSMMGSWKWDMVADWIRRTQDLQAQVEAEAIQAQSKQAAQAGNVALPGGGSLSTPVLLGIGGLGLASVLGVVLVTRKKSKK